MLIAVISVALRLHRTAGEEFIQFEIEICILLSNDDLFTVGFYLPVGISLPMHGRYPGNARDREYYLSRHAYLDKEPAAAARPALLLLASRRA